MKLPEEQIRYIDRPEITETFVNSVGFCAFDGANVNAELCVTRLDPPTPSEPKMTARKYPACRIVLTPQATIELFNVINNMMAAMKKEGIIKEIPTVQPGETRH